MKIRVKTADEGDNAKDIYFEDETVTNPAKVTMRIDEKTYELSLEDLQSLVSAFLVKKINASGRNPYKV